MNPAKTTTADFRVVTKERLLGSEQRWRRFGEPTPAGGSIREDGTPDYGLFGPGSLAWEVILHPATIVLETVAQGMVQTTYRPIHAGVRDRDPMTRKGHAGTLTVMDMFDRAQRNSGIHAPMWLGDTATATRVASHLQNIHAKVTGEVIDVGDPELGGYDANSPRDAMWATLTEMESMLWLYEAFAFRDGSFPRRLTAEQRDRYIAEFAPYVQLFPHADEPPRSTGELAALREKYAPLFDHSATMETMPDGGHDYHTWLMGNARENFHRSQVRVLLPMLLLFGVFKKPMMAAMSDDTLRAMGVSAKERRRARRARRLALPLAWLMQRKPVERYLMRLMWGPDAVTLIDSARKLHKDARVRR